VAVPQGIAAANTNHHILRIAPPWCTSMPHGASEWES
jgi:hypothetical protein